MQPRLYAYILSLVANRTDAKDVLQESNRVIMRKIGELKQADRFGAWAYKIAYFQSLSFLKKRKRDRHSFGDELLENLSDLSVGVDDETEGTLRRLENCLAKLQEKPRSIVSDYYYGGLSTKDIAAKRGLAANHVAQILFRARKALFECMTQSENSDYG